MRAKGGSLLLNALISRIRQWEEFGIVFDEVCTVAWTTHGQDWCERLGLTYLTHHEDKKDAKVYWAAGKNLRKILTENLLSKVTERTEPSVSSTDSSDDLV